ncbi:hypothetical protein L6232_27110, partial [Shewanella sp. C31]|nr:hypothetical protein [Shewanella electrica]
EISFLVPEPLEHIWRGIVSMLPEQIEPESCSVEVIVIVGIVFFLMNPAQHIFNLLLVVVVNAKTF